MMLDHAWIAAHIPHQGNMCLLDSVDRWDASEVICSARNLAMPDHPLRTHQRLGITLGIEYAAQAMAVHGALLCTRDTTPGAGYLASVRNVHWSQPRLDLPPGTLQVQATRISGTETTFLYEFALRLHGQTILQGRASVLHPLN